MIAAGLLAKKAVEKGLTVPPYVKTSLAPGSRVVTEYLQKAGLLEYLDKLGFNTVGYGCTTCIGNSGPLPEPIAQAVERKRSRRRRRCSRGNRNFEGRINPHVKANYLASPPLVVAYALAGTTDIDLERAARRRQRRQAGLSQATSGRRSRKCTTTIATCVTARNVPHAIRQRRQQERRVERDSGAAAANCSTGTPRAPTSRSRRSSMTSRREPGPIQPINGAACLAMLGDSVTTDHISPAGSIKKDCPAGKYPDRARRRAAGLQQLRRPPRQRPRDDARHVRQHPHPQPARPRHRRRRDHAICPTARVMTIYDAAMKYQAERTRRWSSSPARNTAPAPAATGPPRARSCSACGR